MKNVAELVKKPARFRTSPDQWKHAWPLPDTLMGIEVEVERVEGVVMAPPTITAWNTQSDGSLQNGVEYVLRSPMSGAQLRGAINELFNGTKFTRTMTGSTHVHMDMLEDDTSPEVLRTMVMMVYALEPMLYAAGDASREWCGYANRLMTGPDALLSVVMDDTTTPEHFYRTYNRGSTQFGRYYGLNMAALLDYGSLEFRYFPTATSEEELISWVELVQSFKLAATAVGSRSTLSSIVESEEEFMKFLYTYFGKWEHLFPSLGKHHELRSVYRKASITANVSSTASKPFNAKLILSDTPFLKLLKNPPKDTPAGSVFPVLRAAGSQPIPEATDYPEGAMLIYNRNLYHTDGILSEDTHQRPQNWYVLMDYPISHYAQNARFVATLQDLVDSDELRISTNNGIRSILEHADEEGLL